MRISACMWGGHYNPIIPVFRKAPKAWSAEFAGDKTGLEIARGYIRFFEPDAFVEAKPGLLETLGLEGLRGTIANRSTTLDELLSPERHKSFAELHFGLPVLDALAHIYGSEERFLQRDPRTAIVIEKPPSHGAAEAMFGVFPTEKDRAYFAHRYEDTYKPEPMFWNAETWRQVYLNGVTAPFTPTSHMIEPQRTWQDDLKLFVFDPTKPTDIIDLWNLKSEPAPLIPIPVGWVSQLVPDIQALCRDEYRPLEGNPSGMMHSATLEFSRGISAEDRQTAVDLIRPGLPTAQDQQQSLTIKQWRDRIWDAPGEGMMNGPERMRLFVEEAQMTLAVQRSGDYLSANFQTLRPSFASRFGTSEVRWVNSLRISNYGRSDLATIYPYNTFDRTYPRLSVGLGDVLIGSEGWSITQQFSGLSGMLQFETQETAIIGLLKRSGYTASLSEPGHIAKQVLEQLGGLRGSQLIADEQTLVMMNDMAGGIRRRQNGTEETQEQFDPRSRTVKQWSDLIGRRMKRDYGNINLDNFTKRNVLILGLETRCINCQHVNWGPMNKLGYALTCSRCLKDYPFPQGGNTGDRKWTYRVAGPFSVQDYAKGAYGAVLALRAIDELNNRPGSLNFITAVQLNRNGHDIEADYVALHQPDSFGEQRDPTIIFGEAKSFGEGDTLKPKDIARLQALALQFPGCYLAVSVLRKDFTDSEKVLLRRLVRWTRKLGLNGGPRNFVVLLTGHELLRHWEPLSSTWETIGGKHADFADFHNTRSLRTIAEASISIHLGLPSFSSQRHAAWTKRKAGGAKGFPRIPGQWGKMLNSVSGPDPLEPAANPSGISSPEP